MFDIKSILPFFSKSDLATQMPVVVDKPKKQQNGINRPKDLLQPKSPIYFTKHILISATILLIMAIVFIFIKSDNSISDTITLLQSEEAQLVYLTLIISVFSSLIASNIYGFQEDKDNSKRLSYISGLADKSYIDDIISDLEWYENRFYSDYSIRITLEKIPNFPGFILVKREDTYRKRVKSKVVAARIIRNPSEDKALINFANEADLSEIFAMYEFYQRFDESSIVQCTRDDDNFSKLYSIKNIFINRKINVPLEEIEGSSLHKKGRIPDGEIDENGMILFNVEAQWPMEDNSFYSVILEFPCKGIEVTVDYKDVVDLIDLTVEDFLSSRVAAPPPIHDEESGIKRLFHHGWQPAKSNIVLVWWKK
jgi:hypothetical protein